MQRQIYVSFSKPAYLNWVIQRTITPQPFLSNMHYNDTDEGHFSRAMNYKNHKDKPHTKF